MDCRDIIEKLHSFHDGELSNGENWVVEEHISLCDSCRRALEEIKEIDSRLLEMPGVKASDHFDGVLMQRIRKGHGVLVVLKSRAAQLALAAGVMVAVGIVAVIWLREHQAGQEQFLAEAEYPNLGLLDDDGFLGMSAYSAGIGDGLEVQFAVSDSQDKEN